MLHKILKGITKLQQHYKSASVATKQITGQRTAGHTLQSLLYMWKIPTSKVNWWLKTKGTTCQINALQDTGSTNTIIRKDVTVRQKLSITPCNNANLINTNGGTMHISGFVHLNASFQGSTTATKALIANRLSHDMILSWQDCIKLRNVPETFPLPSNLGQVNEIHNEAEATKETLTNKFKIVEIPCLQNYWPLR